MQEVEERRGDIPGNIGANDVAGAESSGQPLGWRTGSHV
jgi:hypothetical protein